MFSDGSYSYYYIASVVLQAICVIHCLKKGTQNKWIWLIIFLPVIGSIAYIYTEMFSRGQVQNLTSGVGAVLMPTARVKKLEEQLRFADTFNNRIALADAYLASGRTDAAIDLYEKSLTGAFAENEHVLSQLIVAYSDKGRYADILPIAQKISKQPQFARSRAHMLYALALEKTGNSALAEKEFKTMKAKFSYYEHRYEYGLFLGRAGRLDEARQVFEEIVAEASHLSAREKRDANVWFAQAKDALKKMRA